MAKPMGSGPLADCFDVEVSMNNLIQSQMDPKTIRRESRIRIKVATEYDVTIEPYSAEKTTECGYTGYWEADSNYTYVGGQYKIEGAKIEVSYTEESKKTYWSNDLYDCIRLFLEGRDY